MSSSGDAARLPTSGGVVPSSAPAAAEDEVTAPNPKSISLEMWRAFALMDEASSLDAIRRLEQFRGGSMFSFEVVSPEGSSTTTEGTYSPTVTLPPGTPKSTVSCWKITKPTSLMRVVNDVHCLALDGNPANEPPNSVDFIACGQHISGSGLASECAIGTHTNEKRKNRPIVKFEGAAYAIKVWTASTATKTKIHSYPILLESDLPPGIMDLDFVRHLEQWTTPSFVWRHLIKFYPGRDKMIEWMTEAGVFHPPRIDVGFSTPRVTTSPSPPDEVQVETVYSEEEEGVPNTSTLDTMMQSAFARAGTDAISIASSHHSASSAPKAPSQRFPWEREFDKNKSSQSVVSVHSLPTRGGINNDHETNRLRREVALLKLELSQFSNKMTGELAARDKSIAVGFTKMHDYIDDINHDLKSTIVHGPQPSLSQGNISWEDFSDKAKEELAHRIVEAMDVGQFVKHTEEQLGMPSIKRSIADVQLSASSIEARVADIEREFTSNEGAIFDLRRQLEDWEKRRDSSSSTRGGYTFRDEADVDALVSLVPDPEFYRYFLDIFSYLSLCNEAFTTYERGITVRANAIKASFATVLSSQVRLSYKVPYPEVMVKTIEAAETVSGGGTKWAPMFGSAEAFEDQFRVGAHRRVMQGIENMYDLMNSQVDATFPLSGDSSRPGTDTRRINMIIQEHNRLGYQQTKSLIDSFLPMHKTFINGGLSSKEAWDRVHIFAREFLSLFQKQRVASADLTKQSALIWGSLKATDLGEEFRKAKFIEHPKVLSILALTSLEREGKSINDAMAKIQSEKDSIKALTGRISKAESSIKTLQAKVQ